MIQYDRLQYNMIIMIYYNDTYIYIYIYIYARGWRTAASTTPSRSP